MKDGDTTPNTEQQEMLNRLAACNALLATVMEFILISSLCLLATDATTAFLLVRLFLVRIYTVYSAGSCPDAQRSVS